MTSVRFSNRPYDPDTSSADAIAQRFAGLFFAYGCVLPSDQLFVGLTLSNESAPNPKIYMVRHDAPDKFADFFAQVVTDCQRDNVSVTGIGFMDEIDGCATCLCQDNFLNKCDALIMPVDNEGEPDCQIVPIRGTYTSIPQQMRDLAAMSHEIFQNLTLAEVLHVAG